MLVPYDDPELLAFAAKIIDEPFDDVNKLAFADWLCDRDDPRGPLMRVTHLVRQAAGEREPSPRPKRSKIRDPANETRTILGPVPVDWESPYLVTYPSTRPPDVTVPKIESFRGAHGAFRLLSLAVLLDELSDARVTKNNSRLWSALAAVELHACDLVPTARRNAEIDDAFVRNVAGWPGGHSYDYKLIRLAALARERTGTAAYLTCFKRFGSYVNVVHNVEYLRRQWYFRGGNIHRVQWHVRTRSLKMVGAWKALTPWVDGKRAWDAKKAAKQDAPPKSDKHKRWQIACGKYACDHTLLSGNTAYQRQFLRAAGVRGEYRVVRCRFCNHERERMPAGS